MKRLFTNTFLTGCLLLLPILCFGDEPLSSDQDRENPVPEGNEKITVTESVILGVVEGVTEYLPVSSTGHLILTAWLLGLDQDSGGLKAFEIVIQLGAILAVLTLYKKPVTRMVMGGLGRDPAGLSFGLKLFVAFLPAAIVGLMLEDVIDRWLFSEWWVAFFLGIGGIGMIAVEAWYRRCRRPPGEGAEEPPVDLVDGGISWLQAIGIGCFQCLALCPGMSRSMVTIVGGLVVGLVMIRAAEFSFLLALPTLGAATLYKLLKSWDALLAGVGPVAIIVGLVVGYLVAILSVRLLVRWLTRHGLTPFGIYRVIIAILVGVLLFAG